MPEMLLCDNSQYRDCILVGGQASKARIASKDLLENSSNEVLFLFPSIEYF